MLIWKDEPTVAYKTISVLLTETDGDLYDGVAPSGSEARVKRAGQAESDAQGTWAKVTAGYWEYTFSAAEVNTYGKVTLRINKAGLYGDIYEHQVTALNPNAPTNLGMTNIDAALSSRLPTTSYENVAAWLDSADTIETGLTIRKALRLIASTTGAKSSGAGTGTEVMRAAVSDSKVRVTATVDANGNRTGFTYDLS